MVQFRTHEPRGAPGEKQKRLAHELRQRLDGGTPLHVRRPLPVLKIYASQQDFQVAFES
jgi:hypothetical protein